MYRYRIGASFNGKIPANKSHVPLFMFLLECVDMYVICASFDGITFGTRQRRARSAQDPAVRQRLSIDGGSSGSDGAGCRRDGRSKRIRCGHGLHTPPAGIQHCAHVTALLQLLKPRMTRWRLQPHHVFVKRFSAEGRCECQPSVAASRFRCE